MAWTGAYDKKSFLAPILARKLALLAGLQKHGVDSDEAQAMLEALKELEAFVHAIKQIDGPAPELVPIPGVGPQAGSLFMLQVGKWRAYYLLDASPKAYYGALVTHSDLPVAKRLAELQMPGGNEPLAQG